MRNKLPQKKRIRFGLTATLLFLFVLIKCSVFDGEREAVVSSSEGTQMYLHPTEKSSLIDIIPFRSRVIVLSGSGNTGEWNKIRWKGKEGWIKKESIEVKPHTDQKQALTDVSSLFPARDLPFDTSIPDSEEILSGMIPHESSNDLFPANSTVKESLQIYYYSRLPDYKNIKLFVYATVQQESGGMLLHLVSYSMKNLPIDELEIKSDKDSGNIFYVRNTVIDGDYIIRVSEIEVKGEFEGEDFREDSRSENELIYTIDEKGFFVRTHPTTLRFTPFQVSFSNRSGVRSQRQAYYDFHSVLSVGGSHTTVHVFHDSPGHIKTDSGPSFFCRKIGIKDP